MAPALSPVGLLRRMRAPPMGNGQQRTLLIINSPPMLTQELSALIATNQLHASFTFLGLTAIRHTSSGRWVERRSLPLHQSSSLPRLLPYYYYSVGKHEALSAWLPGPTHLLSRHAIPHHVIGQSATMSGHQLEHTTNSPTAQPRPTETATPAVCPGSKQSKESPPWQRRIIHRDW